MVITASALRLSLGGREVLRGIDFAATAGTFTAIIGPNGSGKTTLLRALSGELAAVGQIRLNGHDPRTLEPWRLAMMRAVLPQASRIGFSFTVREIVALGVRAGGCGDPDAALARVDLAGQAGRMIDELSGGQQQRVHLARVLCQVWSPVHDDEPRLLLLDEPVSSLDIRHQLMVMDIARDFAARGGAVVAVLHDLNLAAFHADRLVALRDGLVCAEGAPAELLVPERVAEIFGVALPVVQAGSQGRPFVLPVGSG